MCAPLAAVPYIVMAVSAAVSAAAAIQQGQTARQAANMNADAQRASAISQENVGAQESADQIMKAKRIEASQVAQAGAGGVDPSTGTPLTMESQTAEFGELDSLRIVNNAQRVAWGLQSQANIGQYQGQQMQTGSYLNAGSTLLGAASNAYFGTKK